MKVHIVLFDPKNLTQRGLEFLHIEALEFDADASFNAQSGDFEFLTLVGDQSHLN